MNLSGRCIPEPVFVILLLKRWGVVFIYRHFDYDLTGLLAHIHTNMEIKTVAANKIVFSLGDASVDAHIHNDTLVIDAVTDGKSALLLLGSMIPNIVMCSIKSSLEVANQIRRISKRPPGTSRIISDNRPVVKIASEAHSSFLKEQVSQRHIRTESRLLSGMQKEVSAVIVDNMPPNFLSFVHFLRSVYFDKSDQSEITVSVIILRDTSAIERESACITFGALLGANPYEVIIPHGCLYPELRRTFTLLMESIKAS